MKRDLSIEVGYSSIEIENRKKKREKLTLRILSISGILLFFVIWQLVVDTGLVSGTFLAPPTLVFTTFLYKLVNANPDGSTLPLNFLSSFKLAIIGFAAASLIGTPLGLFMGYYKAMDRLVRPLFEILRPIPPLAWIPLSILLLGIGVVSKTYIIFLAAFVPCVINSYTAVKLTNQNFVNVARTCGASRWQVFTKICIPSALPLVFTGLKIALGNAWSTLVAAELVASSSGLGYMIMQGRALVRPDIIIVGMLSIGFTGALMAYGITKLENVLVPWRVKR